MLIMYIHMIHQNVVKIAYFVSGIVILNETRREISNNVVCATSKGSDQSAHMCSLIRAFVSRLNIL